MSVNDDTVNVRYMVDDVEAAIGFYTTHFGFTLLSDQSPAFADVVRGRLRLLLSGPKTPPGGPCRTGASLGLEAGTASTSSSRTSPPRWSVSALPASGSATRSQPARAASRSWSTTRPATPSSLPAALIAAQARDGATHTVAAICSATLRQLQSSTAAWRAAFRIAARSSSPRARIAASRSRSASASSLGKRTSPRKPGG